MFAPFARRVAVTTVAASSEEPSSAPSSAPAPAPAPEPRYSKRKRAEVKYFNDSDGATDSETECLPLKRLRPTNRNTKPRPQNKIFPFLSLPAELRNRIYEECLPDPTQLPEQYEHNGAEFWIQFRQKQLRRSFNVIEALDTDSYEWDQLEPGPKRLGMNLLAVCKQIYDEMAPMFYRQRLVFQDPDALISFTSHLSPRTAKLIRHMEIRTWGNTRTRKNRGFLAMTMLGAKGVTNLEVLRISCALDHFYSSSWGRNKGQHVPIPKRVAKKAYRDCHVWLEAVAVASGDYLKGADILQLGSEDNYRYYDGDPDEALVLTKKELKKLLSMGP
ncbi:hypothetical protein BS50DRAFT_488573 [Corynespora cassiicola Philippines]|uniref:DUF7730 domain-containing protein n=1 Tax=Corynespora cassiicola Philippines TaxID=1448308 RepID=A0A2T2NYZ0_CORCC|nr:hypothetical protein BS50DRAFT_488573 [Corynespora cassiicola Philippines]